MKRVLIRLAIGTVLLVIGFVGGRIFQHLKSGYYFQVHEEKEYPSAMGAFHWSVVSESVGMPILEPAITIIKYRDRTIYKAQRYFQENYPYARNIKTSDNGIEWDDGELRFHLTLEEMKKEPNQTGSSVGPIKGK